MKLLVILIITMIPLEAFARIGETREQCDKRYGKLIIPPLENDGIQYLNYRLHGFAVDLNIIGATCQKIKYIKEDEGIFAPEEIAALLGENGKNWQEVSKTEWKNQECSAKVWGKYLVIVSKTYQEHIEARKSGIKRGQ